MKRKLIEAFFTVVIGGCFLAVLFIIIEALAGDLK